jgi:hypothetical protein
LNLALKILEEKPWNLATSKRGNAQVTGVLSEWTEYSGHKQGLDVWERKTFHNGHWPTLSQAGKSLLCPSWKDQKAPLGPLES